MTRAERVREVRRLAAVGLTGVAIGRALGLSTSYVNSLLRDPDGREERARKARYRQPCPRCGSLMSGSDGRGANAPRLCAACAPRRPPETSDDHLIAEARRFYAKHGRPPSVTDWSPCHAIRAGQPERAQEYRDEGWPSYATAAARFPGGWHGFLRAAGLPLPKRGYQAWTPASRGAKPVS